MTDALILVEKSERIATVTLNRPKALNAISRALREELARTIDAIEADDEVGVVILTGAGRAFSAGVDLKELGKEGTIGGNIVVLDPVRSMARCSKPIIGAINGFAITGGFEIALACDVLIASTEARFADTHARVGIVPGWGLSQKLSRVIGLYRAKELSFTGNYLTAAQAEAWGLVNRVVAPEDLLPTCRKLAQEMLSVTPGMLGTMKALIDEGYAKTFGEAMAYEKEFSAGRNTKIAGAEIEARRAGVISRGKEQQTD